MDKQIIERAVEAAAKAMCADEVASVYSSAEWDDPDCDRGWYLRNARAAVTAALAEVEASLTAERDDLAARVARVEALHVREGCDCIDVHDGTCVDGWQCYECRDAWPCPTIEALRGESE